MKNRNLRDFGLSLKRSRVEAGFNSLTKAIEGIRGMGSTTEFSRATLNLIENGAITDLNTEILKELCRAYSIDFESKLKEYLKIRYDLSKSFFRSESKLIEKVNKDNLILKTEFSDSPPVEIVSLDKFKKIQGDLPSSSIVWVSVINFIDDQSFFDIVLANIKKGVRYYYYLPESSEIKYRRFISMLSEKLALPVESIDNQKCFFVKRGASEFPIVVVLFVRDNSLVEGFVGLSSGDSLEYFQKADNLLSWRLYQSFLMAFSLSLDPEIQVRRAKIGLDLKKVKEIKGFPVLMGSLGV